MFAVRLGRRSRVLLPALLVFLAAMFPRLIGLGAFLTADEKNWVGRGVEFLRAIEDRRINDALQTTHPGIPVLLTSGVATRITAALTGKPFSYDHIRTFVTASQIPLAVMNSLLVTAIFLILQRLFPLPLAFLASLVIAFDPFLVGHSKIVHVDALLAGFTVLGLLLLLHAERTESFRAWLLAGLAAVAAILTKLPGAILLPMALVTLYTRRTSWKAREWQRRLRRFVVWGAFVAGTVILLWPGLVLFVPDPVGNVLIVKRDVVVATTTPHHMAQEYTVNPWQYPAALLTRSTIPTLVGFLLFLLFFVNSWGQRKKSADVAADPGRAPVGDLRTLSVLLSFMVLFIVLMIFGAKKGDRYLLPVFPILDILATVGVVEAVRVVLAFAPRLRLGTFRIAAAVLLLPLIGRIVSLGPYALAHANPLFPTNLSEELGWGEGLDQVAAYLNALPDSDAVSVASWYPAELRALVRRPVFHLNAHEQLPIGYIVLYRNMFGRPPDHPANDFIDEYFRKREPVFTALVNGMPYAWVYAQPAYTGIVGELTAGTTVVVRLPVDGPRLSAVEIFAATYTGRARSGSLALGISETPDGTPLREARIPVSTLKDNAWARLDFADIMDARGKEYVVTIRADRTRTGDAPTLRFAPHDGGAPPWAVARPGESHRRALGERPGKGLLGLRAITNG